MASQQLPLSRRRLLGMAGGVVGVGVFAALGASCQQQPQMVEKSVEVTRVVEKVVVATPAAKAPGQAGAVQLKLSTDWNSPGRKAVMDLMKAEFEKANTNVTIEHWHMGSGGASGPGGYTDIIIAQLVTGTAADVVANLSYGPHVNHFVDISKDAPDAGWNKDDVVFDERNQVIDGKLYMLSMSQSVEGWAYNKTLFTQAGVPEPDESWTFDNVLEAALKLTIPDQKQYGVLARNGVWGGWLEVLWEAGAGKTSETTAEMFSVTDRKSRLAEELAPDAFEWYIDLIHRHKVSPAPGEIASLTSGSISDPFAAGKIAMRPFGIYQSGETARLIGDRFEWSIMPIPKHPTTGKRAYDFNSEGFVIPKVTQQRGTYETALKYALSFYSDPIQKMVAEQRGTLPTRRKWVESQEYLSPPPENLTIIVDQINDTQNIVGDHQQRHKEFGPWLQAVRREMDRAFTGDTNAKDALSAAMKAGDEELAKS